MLWQLWDSRLKRSVLFTAISCLLSSVTLDLSQYAMDIGKAIASKALMDA